MVTGLGIENANSCPDEDNRDDVVNIRDVDGVENPRYRIGDLPDADKTLVTVNRDNDVGRAIALMLRHNFSQLPIMQGRRKSKASLLGNLSGLEKRSVRNAIV